MLSNVNTEKVCSSRKNTELSLFFLPAVYLGVTNLSVYQVRMTSLCAQWQPHRHASAYRVLIESLLSEYAYSSMICGNIRRSFHCFVYTHYSTYPTHTVCYRCQGESSNCWFVGVQPGTFVVFILFFLSIYILLLKGKISHYFNF